MDYSNILENEMNDNYDDKIDINDIKNIVKEEFLILSSEMLPTLEDNLKIYESIDNIKMKLEKVEKYMISVENKFNNKIELMTKSVNKLETKLELLNKEFLNINKSNASLRPQQINIVDEKIEKIEEIFNIKFDSFFDELNNYSLKSEFDTFKSNFNKDFKEVLDKLEAQIKNNNLESVNILKNLLSNKSNEPGDYVSITNFNSKIINIEDRIISVENNIKELNSSPRPNLKPKQKKILKNTVVKAIERKKIK